MSCGERDGSADQLFGEAELLSGCTYAGVTALARVPHGYHYLPHVRSAGHGCAPSDLVPELVEKCGLNSPFG